VVRADLASFGFALAHLVAVCRRPHARVRKLGMLWRGVVVSSREIECCQRRLRKLFLDLLLEVDELSLDLRVDVARFRERTSRQSDDVAGTGSLLHWALVFLFPLPKVIRLEGVAI